MALTWSSEDDPIVWAHIYPLIIIIVILESEDGGDDDDEVLVAS